MWRTMQRCDTRVTTPYRQTFTQSFQCEGRSGAVAQQTLQAQAIVRFYAHAGIDREAPTVLPGAHRCGLLALEHPAAAENPQQTLAHLGQGDRGPTRS